MLATQTLTHKIKLLRSRSIFIVSFILVFIFSCSLFGQNKNPDSFSQLNKKNSYISFSFGMGANYSSNPSIITFIEGDIPSYNIIPSDERLSTLDGGLEFFSGIEYQLAKNFSIKGEYSFFTKSFSVTRFPNYEYSYINHQPYILFNYIIPDKNSFIKIGAGPGYIITNFSAKRFGGETKYHSSGFGIMGEGVANLQISSNVGGYVSVYTFKTFTGDLKDDNETPLLNNNGEAVNSSSFGVGLRLGMEIFIF